MHVVKCPNCASLLKMPQAISQARLKCRKCGVVFVGTSHEVPDAPAPAAPRTPAPAAPPMPTFRTPARTSSNSVMYVTIGLGVALIVLGVTLYVKLKNRASDTPPVAANTPPTERRPMAPPPTRPAPPPPVAPPAEPEPQPAVSEPESRPASAPASQPDTRAAFVPPEKVTVECKVVKMGLPGSERLFLQGSVRNDRTSGLQSATVQVPVPVPGRTRPRVLLIECRFIAPGMRVPFLKDLPPTTLEEGKPAPEAVVVAALPLAANQICWAIDEAAVRRSEDGETYTVTGTARNPKDAFIANVEVYVDAYFSDGRSAGSAQGPLEHGQGLAAHAQDTFTIRIQPTTVGTHMQTPVVRAVATVP